MSTIKSIEDKIMETIQSLNIFRLVDSAGRKEIPTALSYPSAFVYFSGDRNTLTRPRTVMELSYEIAVINKNLRSEKTVAQDTYDLIDSVLDAINGKSLGISDIEPFTLFSRELTGYEDGVISYILRFQTRHYLEVPVE